MKDLSAFRAYDVRGIYGETLTESMVERIGLAFANYLNSAAVVVGHDVRQSSPSLKRALLKGLTKGGSDAIDLGLVPTPFAYLASAEASVEGGVMVTASHNPPEWNGLKLFKKGGLLVAEGLGLEDIRELYIKGPRPSEKRGKILNGRALVDTVKDTLLSGLSGKLRGKVVVDLGNGSCAPYAAELLVKAGLEVELLNEMPDGRFPSRGPEPKEENLRPLASAVVKLGYDFGVAYDGDGDRAVFVDDRGRILPGDIALALFAKHYLIKYGKGKIVADVSCSMAVKEVVTKYGGELVISRVGHAYLLNVMVKEKALVGGEIASHFYFSEIGGIDDAIFATMKMAEVVAEAPISEQLNEIPQYPSTPVITYECQDEIKFSIIERLASRLSALGYVVDRLDGVKIHDRDGWALVRASNTLPQIKLRAEAKTREKLLELIKLVEGELKQAMRT